MTSARIATIPTPVGSFTMIATDSDLPAVLAAGWTDDPALLLSVIAPALRPATTAPTRSIPGITDAAIAYHDGDLGAVDGVAVEQLSGAFLQHAWDILRKVEPGHPVSYTEFAALAGRPAAVRAAAGACARNAAALFVPCHRVVRTDGSLGGFRWGLPAKRWLLDHEASVPALTLH
jgi:methylated-DNA-[protein]-cysteine S-methyltransferase